MTKRPARELMRLLVHQAPGTTAYFAVLAGTWWTLRGADSALAHQVLVSNSTNLHNMARHPVRVLLASPFWMDQKRPPVRVAAEFLLVMAPAERWLGTGRWLLTAAAGHAGATLLTLGYIAYGVHEGLLDKGIVDTIDVGASYGLYAVAARLTFRFSAMWARAVWAATLITYLGSAAVLGRTFTDYGHLAALAIGFSLPLIHRRPRMAAVRPAPDW